MAVRALASCSQIYQKEKNAQKLHLLQIKGTMLNLSLAINE